MRTLILALLASLVPAATSAASRVNAVAEVSQEQDNWCWAATSQTALLYYGVNRAQCEIAEWARQHNTAKDLDLGDTDCCSNLSSCNNYNYFWGYGGGIEEILKHFGGLGTARYDSPEGTLTLAQVAQVVDAGNVFVFRWGWTDGGGHFLVGHGYDGTLMHYMDPWPGEGLKLAEHAWVLSGDDHTWTSTLVLSGSGSSCKPNCSGKSCGDDGCGGSCGSCSSGQSCSQDAQCTDTSSCSHPVCSVGDPLVGGCSSCVTTICSFDSYCCTDQWDETCVSEVSDSCAQSCG